MCLIVLSYQQDANYPLILAANRDEFYARPTAPLDWWQDNPEILAGRDLAAGGTWLGVNRAGAFAAVTNYREVTEDQRSAVATDGIRAADREPGKDAKDKKSRGLLVQNFLVSGDADVYAKELEATAGEYNGFNLLFGDSKRAFYFSNRSGKKAVALAPGLYGLSNHLLDTPWPKVRKAKARFHDLNQVDSKMVFTLLADRAAAADSEVQQTGLPPATEKALSPLFIAVEGYGTRVSSHLCIAASGEIIFSERGYDAGKFTGDRQFNFKI